MQSIKYSLLSLLLGAASLSSLFGQSLWRGTTIVGGIVLGEQDRRLFDYPHAKSIVEREDQKIDYDLTLYVDKIALRYCFLQLNAGVGYAQSNTFFSRPFNHSVLNSGGEDIRHIRRYSIKKLIIPISGKILIGKLYLQIIAIPAVSFNKTVIDMDLKKLAKRQFTLNSLEINPGLGFQLSDKIQISISYRLFYLHEIDKVIFNNLLFYESHPEFLQQKVDTYNPFKMWLTVGYKLKK